MSVGVRPGGLTALAVLNFILGAYGFLQVPMLAVALYFLNRAADDPEMEQVQRAMDEAGVTPGLLVVIMVGIAVAAVLQIISGVGYLKQKRIWGRYVGNLYVFVAVASHIAASMTLPEEAPSGGFTLGTMVVLIYPIYTAVLINTVFRRDLIR